MTTEHHTIERDGYHWHIVTSGSPDAPPVLLLHCWTGDWTMWEKTMQHLEGQYRFIVPDHLGFGQSYKPRGDHYQIAEQAERTKFILSHFGYENRPVSIVGHSMGGQIALTFAGLYPESINRLIVVDPAVTGKLHPATTIPRWLITPALRWGDAWPLEAIFRIGLAFPLLSVWLMRIYFPYPYERIPDSLYWMGRIIADGQANSSVWAENAIVEGDVTPLLPNITAPTLALWGIEDYCIPVSECDVLAQHIPNFHAIRIPDIGHFPMIEAWDHYLDAVSRFLAAT
jgi:pimeloyl-ACP methyl ester carboxylesterase